MGDMTKRPSDEEVLAQVTAMAPEPPKRTPAAVAEPPTVDIPVESIASLVASIEKLAESADRGDERATLMLKSVLAEHGLLLKSQLSPENRLHPDISYLNPLGERDHPRPRLKRVCLFLGMPLERDQLTLDEINLLNSIPGPLEIKDKNWRVVFLRDGGGGEVLYISVPYRTMDDLRSIEGGWQRILRDLLAQGTQPQTQELVAEQLAELRAQVAALTPPAPPA